MALFFTCWISHVLFRNIPAIIKSFILCSQQSESALSFQKTIWPYTAITIKMFVCFFVIFSLCKVYPLKITHKKPCLYEDIYCILFIKVKRVKKYRAKNRAKVKYVWNIHSKENEGAIAMRIMDIKNYE